MTGDWTGSGSNRTTSACSTNISTDVTNEQNFGYVTFTENSIGCNMPNTFSSAAVVGQESLVPFLGYGTSGGTAVLTFTFSQPVTNPILHIDRLGGVHETNSTSALLTMITSGIILQRLSGNGPHFEVNGNQITRTPDQTISGANGECGTPTDGVAAGSVQLQGTFSSVSFSFEANGFGGNADAIEIVWELNCPPPPSLDFDNDGIPDVDDLDDDNDGILDTVEQNGIPTLDTDSDGLIDAFDLDSDGDGCNDVIEAGFEDSDANGTLGSAPDDVDANGLIINANNGYTTPNDLDTNSIFDFQERSSSAILQNPFDEMVCVGSPAQFQVLVENSTSMTWELSTDNGITWNDVPNTSNYSGVNSETLVVTYTEFGDTGTLFRIRVAVLGSVCNPQLYSESSELTVMQTANAGQDAILELCSDDSPIDLFEVLGDGTDLQGTWSPPLSSGTHIFDPTLDSAGSYTYTVGTGSCQANATVQITIGNVPEISAVDIFDIDNMIQVVVSVVEPNEIEYSLDGVTFQNENTFEDLQAGEYIIYVRSLNGCGTATESLEIIGIFDYPKFFTPNQDGINDTWQIEQQRLPDTKTYIYDRYGKLLKILVGENERWDGTYRNKKMPSTDYWFKAVSNQEIIFKGHFTLKR
ncbi:MAG: T9SS type B sorting domain-containing protein [Flavobacteriaceae bacterium]